MKTFANGGLDYEKGGFSAGTWAADVGDGLEIDGFTQDFAGEYVELGYSTTVAELDVGLSLIFSNEELVGEDDEAVIFTIGKSFDIK